MNKDLIKKVQAGTHYAVFDKTRHKVEDLRLVIKSCFPEDNHIPVGDISNNYFKSRWHCWCASVYKPTGLKAIPLDDFFKPECKLDPMPKVEDYPLLCLQEYKYDMDRWKKRNEATPQKDDFFKEDSNDAGDSHIDYEAKYAATPSQPTLPECEGVEAFKVISDRINWFSNHHHKFEANELHEALNTVMRLVPPENFNLKSINNGK